MGKSEFYYSGVSINFKKLLYLLSKYKLFNILLFLLFVAGGVLYIYFATPQYRTYMSIEVERNNPNNQRGDFLTQIAQSSEGIETEIDVLRSRFLVEKALKKVNFHIQYFKKEGFKKVEIYNNSPFEIQDFKIKDASIYGKIFKIVKKDENSFLLSMDEGVLNKLLKKLHLKNIETFEKIYPFNETVETPFFSFKVVKLRDMSDKDEYYFKVNSFNSIINNVLNNLSVKPFSFQSTVLKVEYQDSNPFRARDFLNVLGEEYLKQSIERKVQETSKSLKFIENQLKIVNERLQISQERLKKFEAQNKLVNVGVQSEDMIRRISEYEARLAESEVEKNSLDILLKELKRGNYEAVSGFSARYPILANFVQNYQNLLIQRSRLLSEYTKLHPLVQTNENQIKKTKEAIKKTVLGIRKGVIVRIKELKNSIKNIDKELSSLPSKEKEYANLERRYRVNERLYNYLLERESELKVAKAATVSKKRILDKAIADTSPVKPKKSLIMAVSILLGIVSVFLMTVLRYMTDTKIKSKKDIEEITDIPIYGELPFIADKKLYKSAYVLENPNLPASEALRTIRTNIEFTPTEYDSKIIVVTSTVPNEGKTVVTANLATILGMGEKKCIVVSCDLRRPELHLKFSLPNSVGLSNVLVGKAKLEEVIWEHEELTNFDIITSGFIPPNPYELLDSKKMKEVIETLRKNYDYIVLDTPPIDLVSDALLLMRYADISLFVCKSEYSERKFIEKINYIVKKYKIKNPGIILNAVKEKYREKLPYDERYLFYSKY